MNPVLLKLAAAFPPSLWNGLTGSDGEVHITKLTDIYTLVANLIRIALTLAGFLAVLFVIYGGILYATSGGNPQAVSQAKKTLSGAIGGLVLAIAAYAIVTFIGGIFS